MQREINISPDQIRLAENLLLPPNMHFDDERKTFIENLATLDLHAVPGSGKTTALLAKLIALEQHLPFADGAGILVISHTNAAVDEIKNKIGSYCPRLFSFPNFVGTIQGFVDTFLAVPYYKTLYKKRPVRIDDEIYNENHFPSYALRNIFSRRNGGITLLHDYRLHTGNQLFVKLTNAPFFFGAHTNTFKQVIDLKKSIRESGFLCFDDAYILAKEYIDKFPGIIPILRKRFGFVFIDEMQDMASAQYELLESLFANCDEVVYQRIGDKNQAIYSAETLINNIWQERNVKEINGSHRLHPAVAQIVESVALNPIGVSGKRKNLDGTDMDIKPVMLVYEDDAIELVIPNFAFQIKSLIDSGKIDPAKTNIYKAIGWTTSKDGDPAHVIKLNHYYSNFSREHTRLKINYPCLESYLHFYNLRVNPLASIRKSILNGILRILRIEMVTHPLTGRSLSKMSLNDYLKEKDPTYYQEFKLMVYQICALTMELNLQLANNLLKELGARVLLFFGKQVTNSRSFINDPHVETVQPRVEEQDLAQEMNVFKQDDIEIEVTTVHSVKGQTHTCTLYLETFYERNYGGKGQYESSRIADQLLGAVVPVDAIDFVKQSLKMAYVGFSRPTHLLCFAVNKTRFDALYHGKQNVDRWDVVHIQQEVQRAES